MPIAPTRLATIRLAVVLVPPVWLNTPVSLETPVLTRLKPMISVLPTESVAELLML